MLNISSAPDLFFFYFQGQNDFSIKVITQELNYLTWEEAFTCLSDERLPDELRAQYCDLIISKYWLLWKYHQSNVFMTRF